MPKDRPITVYPTPLSLWILRLMRLLPSSQTRPIGFSEDTVALALGVDGEETVARLHNRVTLAATVRKLEAIEAAGGLERDEPPYSTGGWLAARIGLSEVERELLALTALLGEDRALQACFGALGRLSSSRTFAVIAETIGASVPAVRKALGSRGRLARAGLVRCAQGTRFHTDDEPLWMNEAVREALFEPHQDEESLLARIAPVAPEPEVTLEDFPHAAADAKLMRKLLTGAIEQRAAGVNILLYGPPGTGKSQLARALCRAVSARGVEVPSRDKEGDQVRGAERLSFYQLAQAVLEGADAMVTLFDDCDDAFPSPAMWLFGRPLRRSSEVGKAARLRMLEDNCVPTIWIANQVSHLDAALVRRFSYVAELKRPPPSVRRRMLERHLEGLPLKASWIARTSLDERLGPGQIQQAARTARLVGDSEPWAVQATLDRTLRQTLRLQGSPRARRRLRRAASYDLSLVNIEGDASRIVAGLENAGRATLCLHGPPGTGKTSFVEHLAERLGMPLATHRASDLLDKYLGGTEERLAAAFASAQEGAALLFLDEADSFLRDRRGAVRSWEVTQVNELLAQMEAFDGIFVCATNLMDSLDQASLRRFDLKLRFLPLDAAQRWHMFRQTCRQLELGTPSARSKAGRALRDAIRRLDGVTAGDFATVARRAQIVALEDPPAVVAAVEDELRQRHGEPRAVGFVVR